MIQDLEELTRQFKARRERVRQIEQEIGIYEDSIHKTTGVARPASSTKVPRARKPS